MRDPRKIRQRVVKETFLEERDQEDSIDFASHADNEEQGIVLLARPPMFRWWTRIEDDER
jgi:hypothetical protein